MGLHTCRLLGLYARSLSKCGVANMQAAGYKLHVSFCSLRLQPTACVGLVPRKTAHGGAQWRATHATHVRHVTHVRACHTCAGMPYTLHSTRGSRNVTGAACHVAQFMCFAAHARVKQTREAPRWVAAANTTSARGEGVKKHQILITRRLKLVWNQAQPVE